MNFTQNEKQVSNVVHNGKPLMVPNHSPSLPPNDHKFEDLSQEPDMELPEEPPVVQIERDLDELTYSGAAINDLEMQLTRTKHLYQQVLVDGKLHVDMLRRKLHSHIIKSDSFIGIWRKARQVQDTSNRAAARYDKANSQHTAAKEMIRVAESQLAECRKEQEEQDALEEPSSPSPLDLAWQEMLNHATAKVVVTERERRDSEVEHRRVLEECKKVMDEYRAVERKLRTHIVKSRPYFQERYRVNQHLANLKDTMQHLEQKINETKQSYSASLRRLEVLNAEMHERRSMHSVPSHHHLDPRQVSSTGTSPEMRRAHLHMIRDDDEVGSVDSLQLSRVAADYSGSTGSLPSIGVLSNSELSQTSESDTKSLEMPLHSSRLRPSLPVDGSSSGQGWDGVPAYQDMGVRSMDMVSQVLSRRDKNEVQQQDGDPAQEQYLSHEYLAHHDLEDGPSHEDLEDGPSHEDLASHEDLGVVSSHHDLEGPSHEYLAHHDLEDGPSHEDLGHHDLPGSPSHEYLAHHDLEDGPSHEECSHGGAGGQSLAAALNRLNQEDRDSDAILT